MPDGQTKVKRIDFMTGRELGPGERPSRYSPARPMEYSVPETAAPAYYQLPQWPTETAWPVGVEGRPRKVYSSTGELIDVIEKPDRTVWRGNEQIGTVDEGGRFVPTPPSGWEQLGGAFKQAGVGALTGLGYLFKPFEYFHEYAATPFAMAVTMPWWSKEAPEITPGEMTFEDIKAFFTPEGEYRKAYKQWEAPKYLRGTLETLPWFALPGIGQVGRVGLAGRGIAGLAEKLLGRGVGKALEYSPYGLMEKALGKVIETPLKVGGRVFKRMTVQREITAPEPTAVEDLLAGVAREHPERLEPYGTFGKPIVTTAQREKFELGREAETTFRKVEVLRNEDRLLKESAVPTLMASLIAKGDVERMFRLKEVNIPGTKLTHELVTHPGIKPKVKDASMALDDVLANPSNYEWSLNAIPARRWAEQYYEIQNSLTKFWNTYIQRPIGKKPGEQYVHSVVTGKRNPQTGTTILEKEMYPAGTRGGISGAAKPLKFKSQIEGIEVGYKYERPDRALAMQIQEYYNMATFKRAMGLIDDLFQDPMARMNKEIADRMQKYISDIKFLGGGVVKVTTKEGKEVIEKYPGLKALIQRIRRGEVPSVATVRAVERRFPELGASLREALEIKWIEIDKALQGISEAILKDTKITRDKFREMLNTVRAKRGVTPAPKAEAGVAEVKPISLDDWLAMTVPQRVELAKSAGLEGRLGSKIWADLTPAEKEALGVVRVGVKAKPIGTARNIMAGELTETLDSLGVEAGKQVRILSQIYRQAYKTANKEREDALKQLLEATKRETARLKAESKAFAPQFKAAREEAIKTAFTEGRIIRLAGYANKIIPDKTEWGMTGAEIADRLMKILTPEKVNVALRAAGRMARMGVTLTAALDLSLLFIQGGLVLGHDIGRWTRLKPSSAFFNMGKEMVKAIWNPKYQDEFIAKNSSLIKEMAENRAVVQKAVEYMRPQDIEYMMRRVGEKIRLKQIGDWAGEAFKQSYGRFGAGFGSGSLAARVQIYKQMRDAWLREGHSLTELGEFVNKVTGVVSSAEMGVSATQQAIESAGLFAPNYTRAYLMVVRDLFRGNKTAGEVRKAMAGMLAGGVIGYVGLCEMLGQEPKLNPAPKNLGGDGGEFMSFKIGNSVIGLPGFWYSAFRMMAWIGAAAVQDPESIVTLDWRENPVLRFWMRRSSPLIHIANEMATQRDFIGRRLESEEDWLRQVSSHFLTIAVQNLWTKDPSEEEGKGKRFGAEIFGLRSFPRGEWRHLEDMENEYAQKEFGKSFDELNREQKDKLVDQYTDLKILSQDARDKMTWESGEDFEIWTLAAEKQADVEYHSIGEQLASALFAGEIDYRTYLDEESALRKIYQGKSKERHLIESMADPEAYEGYEKWREKLPPEDKALDRYWEIRNDLRRTATGQLDWDNTERRVNEFLMSLDSDTRAYVLKNKDRRLRDLPPLMRKIAEIQSQGREVVDEYYDQPEGKTRIQYRRANPSVDAWLLLMGRVIAPQTEQAITLVLDLIRQKGLPITMFPRIMEAMTPQARVPEMVGAGTFTPVKIKAMRVLR